MESKNREAGPFQSKWTDDLAEDNDILKRAKNMSAMAFLMYQFTKGSGSLRTTQDLFTQAEYFAEEANRLYKVLRHFSYQVCLKYCIKFKIKRIHKVANLQLLEVSKRKKTI